MLWIIIIIATVYGLACLLGPEAVWELRERMRYKDSDREPSYAGLVMIRLQGAVLIVAAVILVVIRLRSGSF